MIYNTKSLVLFSNTFHSLKPAIQTIATNQDRLYDELLLMKEGISSLTQQPSLKYRLPLVPSTSSKHKKSSGTLTHGIWLDLPGIMVQYYRLRGERSRFSLLFGLRISKSKVIFAQFSDSWYSNIKLPTLCLSVRNIIPEGAEIIIACKKGAISTVKRLLSSGQAGLGDITTTNETPLTVCISCY